MKRINLETKTGKLFTALQAGQKLTASEANKRFGIKNIAAEASRIRSSGYAVYANQHTDTKGRVTTKYRLGRPSRSVVRAGYRALALGLIK